MNFLHSDDPIIACSTGNHAHAAMAVVRISGFKDITLFRRFFTLTGPIEPRKVYYTRLTANDAPIDDICLIFFQGPKSYNGENILELSVHGNTLNVERIIDLFIEQGGCRTASPGEFTYRALRNRKLTLSQVEGLDLFLNANTGYALDQGMSLLNGDLQQIYQNLQVLFLRHKSAMELSIDFLEDMGEEAASRQFDETLNAFSSKFETLVRRVRPMDQNLVQPEITLAGLPNSGKSSLFNFLLADDRAIVSPVAGTTRDYLSETIVIEKVKYRLIDTAGVRESFDLVESEGIRRTKKKMHDSFFSILLINPMEMVDGFDELMKHSFDAVFFTHADCPGFQEAKQDVVSRWPSLGPIGAINLLSLQRSWENDIFSLVNNKYLLYVSNQPILLDRHKALILEAKNALDYYVDLATYETDVAILSSELNTLGHCISELIGIISPDQVLNSIFSNFCIGK
jgi:tRNA modification GTPase